MTGEDFVPPSDAEAVEEFIPPSDAVAVSDEPSKKKVVSQPIIEPVNKFAKDILPSSGASASAAQSTSAKTPFEQKPPYFVPEKLIADGIPKEEKLAREYEISQNNLVGAQKGVDWATGRDEELKGSLDPEARKSAGKYTQDAAIKLGQAQFKADENIAKLKEAIKGDLDYLGSNLENFTRKSQEDDVIADEVKIDEYAREQARKKGLPEDGYYKNFLYNNAKAEVAQKIIEPDVLKEREKLFKEKTGKSIEDAFGEDFTKGFTKAQEIEATAKTQINSVAQEVNALAKTETEEIAKGVNSQIEQLNAAYQQQAAQVTDQSQADALYQEYTANFNRLQANFLDAQNQINGKYNQRLRRQADEIEKVANQKWSEEAEKYKKDYKVSPDLLEQLKTVSQEAYKKVVGSKEKVKEVRDLYTPAISNYYRSTVSSLGRSLGNLSETMGYDYGKVLGDYMENTYQVGSAELNSWKDLLDASKLAKSAGQLTGAMLPSMGAAAATTIATQGLGAPEAVSMLAGGLAAWTGESMDMAGNIERETFAATGDANKALERSKRMWDAQMAIMPLYSLEMLPFMKGFGLSKNIAKRMAGGAAVEYVTEVGQEYTQNRAEATINADKEFSEIFDTASWKEFGHTALNVAPVAILGAGGQIRGEKSEQEKINDEAKSFALKSDFIDLAPDQRAQFISDIVREKGKAFASAYISNLYTNGTIPKSSANQLVKAMGVALEVDAKAKEYGFNEAQKKVFTAFKYKLINAQEQAANETDPILKQAADAKVKDLEEQTVNFASGKQADYVVMTYPNGEQYVLSVGQGQNAAKNPKLQKAVAEGAIKIEGSGKGVEVVNSVSDAIKAEKKAKVDAEKQALVEEAGKAIQEQIDIQNANYAQKEKQDKESEQLSTEITPKVEETTQEVAGGEDAQEQPETRETTATPAQISQDKVSISELKKPNGQIGTQGVTTEQVGGILQDVLGLSIPKNATMRELVDLFLSDNKNVQALIEFTNKNPLDVITLPDGTKQIKDGHHRAFLLDQAGIKKVSIKKTEQQINEEKTPTQAPPIESNQQQPSARETKGEVRTTEKPVPVTDKEAKKQAREAKKQQEEELKKRKKDLANAEPNDIRQLILQYFYGGGRILTEDFKNETGFGTRGGQQDKVRAFKEFKKRIWAHSGKSPSMDDLVMQFQDEWKANYGSAEDQQAIRNEIIGVLKDFDSKSQIERELERLFSVGGKIVTSRDERNQSQQEEDLMQRYAPESAEEAAQMEAWEAMNRSQQDFVMEDDYTAYLLGRVDEMTEEEAQEYLDNEEKYNQLIKQENENYERESKTNAKDSSATTGQAKAAKEYEAELAELNKKLKDAEKAKRDKLDRISGKVDLFADEAKANELFGAEQNLSAENIAKQLKPETDKIAKLEAEKAAFEANKENYLKKYDNQSEISEAAPEKVLTEKERIEAQRKALAKRIRKNKIGGAGMHIDFGITKSAYNFAVEMVAKEVEKGTKLGAAIAKAIQWIDSQMEGRKWNKGGFAKEMNVRYSVTLPDGKKAEVEVDGSKETAEMINGWYSPLEQGILDAKTEKTTGRDWLKRLAGTTEADEMKWTGIEDFLNDNADKSLTKKEVLDFLKDNRVQIVEVVRKEQQDGINGFINYVKSKYGNKYSNAEIQEQWDTGSGFLYAEYDNTFDETGNAPKFSQYQLEGEKENYKEVLVTLPKKKVTRDMPVEEIIKRTEQNRQEFKSTHFDEPNILVHLRMNTRTDADGNKVLFLEEVQSDWGQKGKKEGFKSSNIEKLKQELVEAEKEYNKLDFVNLKLSEIWETPQAKRVEDLKEQISKAEKEIPTAPFVMDTNAWTKLGLKVALKEAVKQGVDKIAWTTGEQQNDRYDLRKQVDNINYYKNENGTYRVYAMKDGGTVFSEDNLSESQLEPSFGKDVAQKIINNEGIKPEGFKGKRLEGNDLKVGGKGMKGFYGSPKEGSLGIVGNVAKSLFKQEPKTIKIMDKETPSIFNRYNEKKKELAEKEKKVNKLYNEINNSKIELPKQAKEYNLLVDEVQDLRKEIKDIERTSPNALKQATSTSTQHSIDITPEIKQAVESGLPLFKGLEQRKAELRASISKKLAKARGQLGMNNLPLDVIPDLIELAKIHIQEAVEKGGNALKNFIRDIRENYPDILKNVTDQELEEEIFNKANEDDGKVPPMEKEGEPILSKGDTDVSALKKRIVENKKAPKEIRDKIKENGISYEIENQELANQYAQVLIDELGIDGAVYLADSGKVRGATKTFIYGKAIDDAAKRLKDGIGTVEEVNTLVDKLDDELRKAGREISAMLHWYINSPEGLAAAEIRKVKKYNDAILNPDVTEKESTPAAKINKTRKKVKKEKKEAAKEAAEKITEKPKPSITISKDKAQKAREKINGAKVKLKKMIFNQSSGFAMTPMNEAKKNKEFNDALIELATGYIELGYHNFNAWAAKIKEDLKEIGVEALPQDLQEMWDNDYQYQAKEAYIADNAEKLAKKIIARTEKKGKTVDPVKQMINTLFKKVDEKLGKEPKAKTILDKPINKLILALKSINEYRDVWDASKNEVIEKIDAMEISEEEKADLKQQLDFYLKEVIGIPFSDALANKVVKDALGDNIEDILKQAHNISAETKQEFISDLVDMIKNKTGINDTQANQIAEKFAKEYDIILRKKAAQLLDRNFKKNILDKVSPKRKKDHEKIADAIIWNNFANKKDFENLFAEKYGLVDVTDPDFIETIKAYVDLAQSTPEGFLRDEVYNNMMQFISWMKGEKRTASNYALSQFYNNILFGIDTFSKAFSYNYQSMLLNMALLSGKNPKMAKMYGKAMFGKKEGLKAGRTEALMGFLGMLTKRHDAVDTLNLPQQAEKFGSNKLLRAWGKYAQISGKALTGIDLLTSTPQREAKLVELVANNLRKQGVKDYDAVTNEIMGWTSLIAESAQIQAQKELEQLYEKPLEDFDFRQKLNYKARVLEIVDKEREKRAYDFGINTEQLKAYKEKSQKWADKSALFGVPEGTLGGVATALAGIGKVLPASKFIMATFINAPLNMANWALTGFAPTGLARAAITEIRGRRGLLVPESAAEKFGIDIEATRDDRNEMWIKAIGFSAMQMGLAALMGAFDDDDEIKDIRDGKWQDKDFFVTFNMKGNYFDNLEEKRNNHGIEPFTVYIKGRKVLDYKNSPLITIFGVPAAYMDAIRFNKQDDKATAGRILKMSHSYLTYIREQSSMQWLNDIANAMGGNNDYKDKTSTEATVKYLAKRGADISKGLVMPRLIPAAYSDFKGITDMDDKTATENYDYFTKDVPFLDAAMKGETDAVGRPIKEVFDMESPLGFPIFRYENGQPLLFAEKVIQNDRYYSLFSKKDYQYKKYIQKTISAENADGEVVEKTLDKKQLKEFNKIREEYARKVIDGDYKGLASPTISFKDKTYHYDIFFGGDAKKISVPIEPSQKEELSNIKWDGIPKTNYDVLSALPDAVFNDVMGEIYKKGNEEAKDIMINNQK